MISQAYIVESYFGYWPEFSDGKVNSFAYEAPSSILMGVSYMDAETSRSAQIQLKFAGVSEVDLSELKSENVIDSLRITEGRPGRVVLEACYGLAGSFNFEAAEVVSLLPSNQAADA